DTGNSIVLREQNRIVTEHSKVVELGQDQGTRTIRFDLEAHFDETDSGGLVEDLFLVYLASPGNPGQTLLDRGRPGTALFALSRSQVELRSGLVRFDGKTVEIDVSSLADAAQGQLIFQLINSDADTGSFVTIANLTNTIDPLGTSGPSVAAASVTPA